MFMHECASQAPDHLLRIPNYIPNISFATRCVYFMALYNIIPYFQRWYDDTCHKTLHHNGLLVKTWLSMLVNSRGAGAHFTNDFSITIQIRWKFHLAVIQLLVIISRQNLAHATTAQLSCHVPNIVAITILLFGWEQIEISITFELWWKNG